ncbi:hypothetical protein INR49_019993, partial [Caranx melampygus]
VEDLQVPTPPVQVFDPLDVLLMQRHFLQGEDLTLVVFSSAADHWSYGSHSTTRGGGDNRLTTNNNG